MQAQHIVSILVLVGLLALPAAAPAQGKKQEREAAASAGDLNEVGRGTRLMRQELKPGAYITPRHRQAVQAYLAKHHGPGRACLPGWVRRADGCQASAAAGSWKIGGALPRTARLQAPPGGLLAALPKAPPGNRYVLYAGDVLLIASGSRMVVDAVSLAQ